jgi:hypothetical protein
MVTLQASDCSYLMDPLNEVRHFESTCSSVLLRFIWAIIDHLFILDPLIAFLSADNPARGRVCVAPEGLCDGHI